MNFAKYKGVIQYFVHNYPRLCILQPSIYDGVLYHNMHRVEMWSFQIGMNVVP